MNHLAPTFSVIDHLDYRAYLRDVYDRRKSEDPQFSYRVMAQQVGFASAGSLKLAIDGKRNLSQKKAQQIGAALGMSQEETEYFCALVSFCDSKTNEERNQAFSRMKSIRRFRGIRKVELAKYEYFKHWHHLAIREMVSLDDFREDPEWISKRLLFPLPPRDVTRTISKLEKLGFLMRDKEGTLKPSDPVAHTEVEIQEEIASLIAKNFHQEMLTRAAESMDRIVPEKRDIRALTLAISRDQAEKIKTMNVQHMKAILDVALEDEPIEDVYQLNVQWFPLTAEGNADGEDRS